MRDRNRRRLPNLRQFFPNLAIPLIWLALVSLGALSNGWFIRSAEAELAQAQQRLHQVALQTIGREFQRYGLLLSELENVSRGEAMDESAAARFLERISQTWGSAGTFHGLVSRLSTGILGGDAQEVIILRDIEAPVPDSATGIRSFRLNRSAQNRLALGSIVFQNLPPNGTDLAIIAPAGTGSKYVLVLTLAMPEFYKSWVMPALANAIPDAKINWQAGNGEANGNQMPPRIAEPPRFNPILTLFGYRLSEHASLELPLPRFSDFYRGNTPPSGGPAMGNRRPGPFMFMPPGDRYFMGERRDNFSLSFTAIASIDTTAMRLAWNWLGAMALLFGLGLAFTLVVLQIGRLRQSRQREREFVAAVTHELRTPLTVIQSCADNLAGGIIGPERMADYGRLIQDQSHRLTRMIEDVIDFAGVEGQGQQPPRIPIDAAAFFTGLQANLQSLAQSQACRLDWRHDELPDQFYGDPATLQMILENLVLNAGRHAYAKGQGGVIRVNCLLGNAQHLTIEVEDEGIGIPAAEQARVFEPFYRAKASRQNQDTGTGLGLHLARRKASLMGASLSLESPYKKPDGSRQNGCRFSLNIKAGPGPEHHE